MKQDWRQGILYLATIGMEGCWLYAIMDLLNRKVASGSLSVAGLLLVYLLSFGFNILLRRLRWPGVYLHSLSWFTWVIVMLLTLKIQLLGGLAWSDASWLLSVPRAIVSLIYGFEPELLVLISTAVLWWLGKRLAYRQSNFTALVSEFQFGLIMLAIAFLVASLLKFDLSSPVSLALVFFLFALLGISVAHAMEGTGWLSGLYRGHWLGLLLISVSLILIVGVLVSSLVTPDLLQLLWATIKWVGGLIWGLIMRVLAFFASIFPESGPVELPPMPTMPSTPSEGFKLWTMPPLLSNGLRIGWSAMAIGTIIFALWRVSSDILRWLRYRLADMAGAEFEPLPGAFRADFLGLLKRILRKLLGLRLPLRPGVKSLELAPVRQLYQQLLHWAAAGGYPRYISQTPDEYLHALADLLPESRIDLDFITQQYVRTRYGAFTSNEEELHRLDKTWHRVKQNNLKQVKT